MLTINNPNDAEKRQNVSPLSIDDEQYCVDILNAYIKSQNTMLNGSDGAFIQRFIHNYENLKHFYAVAGGWDGLEKLKSIPNYIDGVNNFPDCSKINNKIVYPDADIKQGMAITPTISCIFSDKENTLSTNTTEIVTVFPHKSTSDIKVNYEIVKDKDHE